MYIYTLSNEVKQLIRTISPDMLIDIQPGIYSINESLKIILRDSMWQNIDEYSGALSLEVKNG